MHSIAAKNRIMWLPEAEKKCDYTFSRFDTTPACDRRTDGQTEGRTFCGRIVRAMHMHEIRYNSILRIGISIALKLNG